MGLYDDHVLPIVIHAICSSPPVMKMRARAVPRCAGVVLEVGAGSGINFALYDPALVEKVYALEPSAGMRRRARRNLATSPVPVEWLDLPGEQIPLADNSVDTVLLTYTLCTIPDAPAALAQMWRVLKPGGALIYAEHGLAPDAGVAAWQHRITPTWKQFAGGCHLNRPIAQLITDAGFVHAEQDAAYADGSPRFVGHMFTGLALKPG